MNAIKPDFFVNVPSLQKQNEASTEVSDEEKALYAMSVTAGWKIFSDMASNLKTELDTMTKEAVLNGMPLEEIGRMTVVTSLAQEAVTRLLNRVSDAVEAVEANGSTE